MQIDDDMNHDRMETRGMEAPLSESSVSLKLEEIQKRCSELLSEPDSLTDLSLVEPAAAVPPGDPYNHIKR